MPYILEALGQGGGKHIMQGGGKKNLMLNILHSQSSFDHTLQLFAI